ncbi:ABC transporter permease [Desulforhabdus amnigena]|uniref:Transport permease protein n=1 Tax=Desulforhabdus amnigena TaxID=40218 RepID=A0A9W6FR55_9BACT|nr:ABC transporter permease [Desulforhabdus amnigena]GLI32628.1 sugar ABC transporter permease [Desulforhabdus amnigena]
MKVISRKNEPYYYDSAKRQIPMLEEFLELFRYRELLAQFVARNIKIRYKRSVLGVAWTMLNPLFMMVIMTLVFSKLFRFTLDYYPVYVLTGFIFWNFFSQTTTLAMNELVWGGNLLTRIYMPRAIFGVTALGTGLVNIFLALVPLLLIMLVTGAPLRPALFFLPVSILLLAMFTLGVGLFLSMLAVYFVDILEIYQVVLLALMYLSPVIYPIQIIPEGYVWVFKMNPIYYLLEVFRSPIYYGCLPDFHSLLFAMLISLGALLFGWWSFARKADDFAYRI